MKKGILITLFVSLILVLAACGGSDESSGESSNTASETNTSESAEGSSTDSESGDASANNELDIVATDFEFNQDEYVVQAGEEVTVSLTSKEGTHGIKIEGTEVNIQGDGTTTFSIDEPGEYTIRCSVPCGEGHSSMMSTLVVEK